MDASLQSRAEQLADEFASQARTAEDLNGLMRLMMKSALERMLNSEMDVHLGRKKLPRSEDVETSLVEAPPAGRRPRGRPKGSLNRRNGHSPKTVGSDLGEVTIATPAIATARSSRSSFPSINAASPVSTRRSWPYMPKG